MARPLRIQFPGALYYALYYVALRGNERRPIFRDDADCHRFLKNLARSAETYSVRVFLYCLMGNHVYLLVETPLGNLSAFMGVLVTV